MISSLLQANQGAGLDVEGAARLGVAGLIGLAVGLEREWSGHASGPGGRFAGIRTFFLLGLLGGGAGLLAWWDQSLLAAVLLAAGALFGVIAYTSAVRRPDSDLDGTTEGAVLVVLALGAIAGLGRWGLAAGAGAVVVLALGEKARLHSLVRRIGEPELRAALQFAVLALVVLPLLPAGPYGPFEGVRPRALWSLVLLLCGINFAGYIARRAIGPARGYGVTGLLGGIVSSTAVTLQFSRMSRRDPQYSTSLALGVIAACTVLPLRVGIVAAVLDFSVARALVPFLVPPAMVGAAIVAISFRRKEPSGGLELEAQSPLRLWSAIQMGILFQLSMTSLALVSSQWGSTGVVATGVVLGLTDVDALTVSMTRLAKGTDSSNLAALGIGVGIISNTLFKLAIGLTLGAGAFRRPVAAGLAALAVASGIGMWMAQAF